jgi:hypothetical protein
MALQGRLICMDKEDVNMPNIGGIPKRIDLISSPVVGGGSVTCTITIDALPSGGTTIQVGVDSPGLVSSPSGWPYGLTYPSGGGITASFTITTNSVASDTSLLIYACSSGSDITNPANWTATATLTITHV